MAGIEIQNLRQFEADLNLFSKKVGVNFITVLKKVSLDIFAKIIMRTPVDTGLARASWVIGVNELPAEAAVSIPKGQKISEGSASTASLRRSSALDIKDPYSMVVIANYLPYIQELENGSSVQAPAGMVRLSIEEEFSKIRSGAL